MSDVRDRAVQALKVSGKSMRRASLDGGLSEGGISKFLREVDHSPTLETIEKVARGIGCRPEWLAFGLNDGGSREPADGTLAINAKLLRDVLSFVLLHEGVTARRAALLAHILPSALAGPPVDEVEGDPLRSFRVHLQLEEQRYVHPEPG